MINEYFQKMNEHVKKYGEKTLVLWECGKFLEIYGLCDPNDDTILTPYLIHIRKICGLALKKKNEVFHKGKCVMITGIPTISAEKWISKLQKAGWTLPVYLQNEDGPPFHRKLKYILSPGTYLDDDPQHITNNVMCCWIEKNDKPLIQKPYINCGMACIDIFTGKSNIYEFKKEYYHHPTTFDELERFYSIYRPNELIVIYEGYNESEIDDVLKFSLIHIPNIHKIPCHDEKNPYYKEVQNCERQIYQQELIKLYYQIPDFNVFMESLPLNHYPIATQCFCFLLEFIQQHNPDLIKNIPEPSICNINADLELANHSLKQLNILNTSQNTGQYSSLLTFINKCKTSMGIREFNNVLMHPITDDKKLTREYTIIKYIISHYTDLKIIRSHLSQMCDMEKIYRKIILKSCTPADLTKLFQSLQISLKIYNQICERKEIVEYISLARIHYKCSNLIQLLENTLDFDIAVDICSLRFEDNCFIRGVSKNIDQLERNYLEGMDKLKGIQQFFDKILGNYEKKGKKKAYVCINQTDKNGYYLTTTKRRSLLLKEGLKKLSKKATDIMVDVSYISSYDQTEQTFNVEVGENIQYINDKKSKITISSSQIQSINRSISSAQQQLRDECREEYLQFIKKLMEYGGHIETVVRFIISLDIILTKAHISIKNNYCCPKIDMTRERSFFDAENLRHPLIENLLTQETYVPNNISLGTERNGIILFGTNAVGKSSLIRSIGMTIILAQSGMYVPCSSLVFKPYTQIFTRILGNDNIFKGLSTFAVEMTELRTILNIATENSLILGDELCSGTETTSAIDIFCAGIIMLEERKSSFIFATHYHEITKIPRIIHLRNVEMFHMKVTYNREKDLLVYNRKLCKGPGCHRYGLEVCKSLKMPIEFMRIATSFRDSNPILTRETSHFNAKKIRGRCEKCGKDATEIHHLQHQNAADNNGFIGTFHKNHRGNLFSVCESCHHAFHKDKVQHRNTKTSQGMQIIATT